MTEPTTGGYALAGRPTTAEEFSRLTGLTPERRPVSGRSDFWVADAGGITAAEVGYRQLSKAGVAALPAMLLVAAVAEPDPAAAAPHDIPTDLTIVEVLTRAADAAGKATSAAGGDWQACFNVHGDPFIAPVDRPYRSSRIAEVSTAPTDYGRANCRLLGASGPGHWRTLEAMLRRQLSLHSPEQHNRFTVCATCRVQVGTNGCDTLQALRPVGEQILHSFENG